MRVNIRHEQRTSKKKLPRDVRTGQEAEETATVRYWDDLGFYNRCRYYFTIRSVKVSKPQMQNKYKLEKGDKEKIKRLILQGKTPLQVARACQVSVTTVRGLMK